MSLISSLSQLKSVVGSKTNPLSVYTVPLTLLAEGVQSGAIKPRNPNRGQWGTDQGRVVSIAEKYKPAALGLLTVALYKDGTLEVVDGHHQFEANNLAIVADPSFGDSFAVVQVLDGESAGDYSPDTPVSPLSGR